MEILFAHCPDRAKHGKGTQWRGPDGWVNECPLCSPFRPAIEEAKREGYRVAVRLIERNPASAREVLVTLLTARPPSDTKEGVIVETTRCKVYCTGVKKFSTGGWFTEPKVDFMYEAEFSMVTGNSEENKKFFASTPSGQLKFSTLRSDMFEPGKEYYVDISPAAAPQS